MMRKNYVAAAALLLTVAGCATTASTNDSANDLAAYLEAAGPELNSFQKSGSTLHSWQTLSDKAVLVQTTGRRGYLLGLAGGCPGIEFVNGIRVSDQMGTVSRNFDKVYPMDRSMIAEIGCPITSIREVDLKQYRLNKAQFQKAKAL